MQKVTPKTQIAMRSPSFQDTQVQAPDFMCSRTSIVDIRIPAVRDRR